MDQMKTGAFALAAMLALPSEFAAELRKLRAAGTIDQKSFAALLTKHVTSDDNISKQIAQFTNLDYLVNALEGLSTTSVCITAAMEGLLGYSGGSCPKLNEQLEIFKRLSQGPWPLRDQR